MRLANGLCVLLLAGVPAAVLSQDGGEKKAAVDPVGRWEYVSGEKGGEKVDPSHLKDQTVTITKDTITLAGQAKFVMSYKLDPAKQPTGIAMTMTESPFGAGAKAAGIIDRKGDTLRICYATEGDAPTAFESKKGSNVHLFTLKRAK